MTTTNRLFYTVSKRYIQAGTTFKIDVKILLADDCKNNICDWSITADIYEQRKNGRFVWCAGGCCHEEILKRFPQFKMFVDLHLSNQANKKKHSFKLDFNIAFGEYKDGLCKDGIISQSLYQRATLY